MPSVKTQVAVDEPTAEQIVLMRNSERSTFRRCRQKWEWSYNRRLEPQRVSGALTFGSMAHSALELWYPVGRKRGVHPAKTFERIYHEQPEVFNQWDEEGNRVPALELGISMMECYVDEHGKDEHIEILHPEMSMQVDVFDKRGKYLCTWVGQCDAAYRNLHTNKIGLLEHKTAKSVDEELRVNSGYGEQGLSYWWAANITFRHQGILGPDQELDHVLFNWLKKQLPDDRPQDEQGYRLNKPGKDALVAACEVNGLSGRGTIAALSDRLTGAGWTALAISRLGERSARQPGPLFHRWALEFTERNLDSINDRIRKEAFEMAQVRAGKAPIYKNPTKDCGWDCPFRDACELHEMGADHESVLSLEFDQWNPYGAHELEEEKT